jgi:Questin oxidase-like
VSVSAYAVMDDALGALAGFGPELRNGLTNHAPMAAEAMCAMNRGDAVMPWVERYRRRLVAYPAPRERITDANWQTALGDLARHADWSAYFRNEIAERPWTDVLGLWIARLAPALIAAAAHGVIRTGHAVRSLALGDTAPRRAELAEALAYWAASYMTLPDRGAPARHSSPSQAIAEITLLPRERRLTKVGSIVEGLAPLLEFEPFDDVAAMVDTDLDASAFLSDLTATFANVYLANTREILGAIAYIHGVTGPAALRPMLPHLTPATRRAALRYAWQSSVALYAAFGRHPKPRQQPEPVSESIDELFDRAIATRDEHAIKFTEVCVREAALAPQPIYLAAARHAIGILA